MTKQALKLASWATLPLALVTTALAEVKLNDKLALSGYISGTASRTEWDAGAAGKTTDSFMDVDAVKLQATASLDKVTGTISMHTFTSHDPVVLDAYATYAASATTSVTVGNFLSYLGFEAFDYPNMLQISYANNFSAFIPAYHSGVKVDFTSGSVSGGFALLDSVYGSTYYKGDGDLDNGAGFEAFLKFTSGNSSLFAAIAHDNGVAGGTDNQTTFDLWGQTKAGATTLAAEYCYSKTESLAGDTDGYFWLLLAMTPINDKWTITGRLSGGENEAVGPSAKFMKYTLSPAVTITDNLGVLFEYSYIDYKSAALDKERFLAAQVIFKF